ncbi:MAG: transglutaminase-like domain-containing protein [bacterium]|nr:transglutaminase-like domain-containing protein [bacterium]
MKVSPVVSALMRTLTVLAIACATLGGGARAWGSEPGTVERWYVIDMSGKRAGYMRSVETSEADRLTSESEMSFELARGPVKVKIKMKGRFVETDDGKPILMHSVQDTGAMSVEQTYTFREADVEVKTTQAGATRTSTMPLPEGAWLTPGAAERYMKQRRASGAAEVTMRIIDPQLGLTPVTSRHFDFEKATIVVAGKPIEVTRAKVEVSNSPGIFSTEFIDAEGVLVRSETDLGGLSMIMSASTKEEAGAKIEAPEIMLNTFVKPDRPIKNPRSAIRAEYIVSVDGDGTLPEFPVTGTQSVERIDARTARITVDMSEYAQAPDADLTDAGYLAASASLDTRDEVIQAITKDAISKAGDDEIAKARAIRRFVYRFIKKKNLGVGFATATEVARSKEGDCSEHGVLTAALLRTAGIPSRVVAGLVYVDEFAGASNIFGYHMWTQALLTIDGKPRWVDLDATFPASVHFDATHLAVAVSSLKDGDGMGSMASLASVLGRLKIKVESVIYEGEASGKPDANREAVPAGAGR